MNHMNRITLALALVASFALGALAQERLTLTSPLPQPAQVTGYTISKLCLTVEPTPQVQAVLRATDGVQHDEVYEGATATTMILALNKANLSTRSLNQRIFDRLIADGRIAGTVTGSVQ